MNLPQATRSNDLSDSTYGRIEKENVADHQHDTLFSSSSIELESISQVGCEWFLDKNMFPGINGRLHDLKMGAARGSHHESVDC